jgi:hypothetical protein
MHGNWQQYRERLVKITDKVVERHGLEVTIPKHKPEKRSMAEIKMRDRGQVPWKDKIRNAIDTTMREAHISDFKNFKEKLGEFAVNVIERGRDLTYSLTGTNYKARGQKLGDDYKKETIFNELDRRNERKLEQARGEASLAWLKGRGKQVESEQLACQKLAKRAERIQRDTLSSRQSAISSGNDHPRKSKERGYGGPSL